MSSSTYAIKIYDAVGQQLTELGDFVSLDVALVEKRVGRLVLSVNSTALPRSLIKEDGRVEVWRAVDSGPYRLLGQKVFFIRRPQRKRGLTTITALCSNTLLNRRIIAYASGTAYTSKTDFADDMIKAIARENLGSLATDADRDWSAYLSVAADQSLAPELTKAFARQKMLPLLQALADASAEAGTYLSFDIVTTAGSQLEFRTFINQRGVDHRYPNGFNPIILREGAGLENVDLDEDWSDEQTVIYAGGQGEGTARVVKTASNPARIGISPFGRIEDWIDSRQNDDEDAVQDDADSELWHSRAHTTFAADLVDQPNLRFQVEYDYGDYLTAVFQDDVSQLETTYDVRLDAIHLVMNQQGEKLTARLRAET